MTYTARLRLTGLPVSGTGRRSAVLAAWATAWLQGRAAADDVVAAVTGTDEPHLVSNLDRGDSLADLLVDLRRCGAEGLRLVLPVAGDPRGLPAPGEFCGAALDAGEALTIQRVRTANPAAETYGLVPYITRHGSESDGFAVVVCWHCLPSPAAVAEPPGTLLQAERELAASVRAAADALAAVDAARLTPAAADAVAELRSQSRRGRTPVPLPPSHPVGGQTLLAAADRLAVVLDIAGDQAAAGIDTAGDRRRHETLLAVAAAVRRARVAAVNAPLDASR